MFDQFGAQRRAWRAILSVELPSGTETVPATAGARPCKGQRLAMISTRGGDNRSPLRSSRFEPVEVNNAAAHLKAPIGVWFSCCATISAPVCAFNSGQTYCGVSGTLARTRGITFSSSAKVNIECVLASVINSVNSNAAERRLSSAVWLA